MDLEQKLNNLPFTRKDLLEKTMNNVIKNIKPRDKNLEIRFIILQKESSWRTKN